MTERRIQVGQHEPSPLDPDTFHQWVWDMDGQNRHIVERTSLIGGLDIIAVELEGHGLGGDKSPRTGIVGALRSTLARVA